MKVILAESAGFCWGVKRAVDRARAVARDANGSVYTDGPLIHNNQLMEQLHSEGILETDNPQSLPPGSSLIVRAHGISPERRKKLSGLDARLEDATCPDVARIQAVIRKHARKGFTILIFGDPGHAEVTGLLGFSEGAGMVVTCPEDIAALPDSKQVCLVAQSTQLPLSYGRIVEAVKARFPNALVIDTICESTRRRQEELISMAPEVDAIVVVGAPHSANTMRLVELARSLKPAFHVQTAAEVDGRMLTGCRIVGLTAGASTPEFIISEVKKALEAIPPGQQEMTTDH